VRDGKLLHIIFRKPLENRGIGQTGAICGNIAARNAEMFHI
jgi:hypothetical protein